MTIDHFTLDLAAASGFSLATNNATGDVHVVVNEEEFILDDKIQNFYKKASSQARTDTIYDIVAILSSMRKSNDDDITKAITKIAELEKKNRTRK